MTPLAPVAAELQQHAKALRALARDLVGECHADDLVQETALRALRSPPPRPCGLGAWLATILRRLAHNHRRDQERRRRREVGACRDEVEPPADAALLHRESLRTLTTALFAVPEPCQGTLLLRYFEGLSPRAIATRTGTPLPTVKSRLQRGLSLLRQQLDDGDPSRRWRAALLLASGAALPLPVATWTTTTLLMTKSSKLIAATVVLCGGAALFWPTAVADAPPALVGDGAPPAAPPVNASATFPSAAAGERVAAGAAGQPTMPDLEHPFGYELRCRVVDSDGLPVAGARLLFAPMGCALNTWPLRTADDGMVTLQWRARQSAMAVAIGVAGRTSLPRLQRIELAAGAPARVELLGEAAAPVRFRVTFAGNKDAPALSMVMDLVAEADEPPCKQQGRSDCRKCHDQPLRLRGMDHPELVVRETLHPAATFADLLLGAAAGPELAVDLAGSQVLTGMFTGVAQLDSVGVRREPTVAADRPATGVVTGFVFAADGRPAPKVTVVRCDERGVPLERGQTDQNGAFRLEGLPPGQQRLRAGGDDSGIGFAMVAIAAMQTCTVHVQLEPGACVRGRALGSDGEPLVGALVEFEAHGDAHRDAAVVREDGTFVVPNVPGGGRLLLWPKTGSLPVAVIPAVLPDAGEARFDLAASGAAAGKLLLHATPEERVSLGCELRAWQVETGRCAPMAMRRDGAFVLDGLMPGFYRVEFGAEALGWSDLGTHWVAGNGTTDLGRVLLPKPGTLELADVPAGREIELYHRRPIGDVRVEFALGSRREVQLPAGEWLLLWRSGDQVLHTRSFRLESGSKTTVALGAGPEGGDK